MTQEPISASRTGKDHFLLSALLSALAWAGGLLLQIALFARPTPYGAPYVAHWDRFFFHALQYDFFGVLLLSLPFLVTWLILFRREIVSRFPRWMHMAQIIVFSASLFLNQIDHEIMRFTGSHLSLTFIATYYRFYAAWKVIFDSVMTDKGIPFLGLFLLLAVPAAYVTGSIILLRRFAGKEMSKIPLKLPYAVAAVAVPLAATLTVYLLPGGKFRMYRVQPIVLTWYQEIKQGFFGSSRPKDLDALIRRYQKSWLDQAADNGWRFPGSRYPYVREPLKRPLGRPGPATDGGGVKEKPWNVIFLLLETFRAWDTGIHRPDRKISPTPFLDSLARGPKGAWWERHFSFGPPTVRGFFGTHCSIHPHSRRNINTSLTYINFYCLPQMLRENGYRTEYFTGADPDWDNQRFWLLRWYDRYFFYRSANEKDRQVFRKAASRIKKLGGSNRPFFATVVSISNHFPFRSKESGFDIVPTGKVQDRILNTMRYTDDVVQEFVNTLKDQPWFRRTLIVVTGDHGYNLGEHDGMPGQYNLYREATWVPLIFFGDHPRLPRGRQSHVASHLDIAPTIVDLLGIQRTNPWQGHSLARVSNQRWVSGFSLDLFFFEGPSFSLVRDTRRGAYRLYRSVSDPLQKHDVASKNPRDVRRLARMARDMRRLNDYIIESNRVWRP